MWVMPHRSNGTKQGKFSEDDTLKEEDWNIDNIRKAVVDMVFKYNLEI